MTLKSLNVACIGAGVIGSGWVARLVLNGVNVTVFDKQKDSYKRTKEIIKRAAKSYSQLTEAPLRNHGKLTLTNSLEEAIVGSHYVIESLPENLNMKRDAYEEIQDISKDIPILSSTSGFKPSDLQHKIPSPQNLLVTHPFNPVYLMPLVEVVPGKEKNDSLIKTIMSLLKDIGMTPVLIKKEIDAFVADRMLESMWREGLWLIKDGICTTEELDQIITSGFGIRFAQMGMFETYRIAGGEAGMKHFIEQFGPALKWPWTKLMDVPELSQALVSKISDQSDDQSGHYSITDLEHIRDDNLVGMMRALKLNDWGAGNLLNTVDTQLKTMDSNLTTLLTHRNNIQTIHRVVPTTWLDLNGHMNDSHYAEVFSQASEVVLIRLGADQEYVDRGFSYFTVDMKVDFLKECNAGDVINVVTDIIIAEGKKLDLKHEMRDLNDNLIARCSQFLLHVDLELRKSCLPAEPLKSLLLNLEATISN